MPVQAVQAWVKDVNRRGGLNGHSVEFLIFDDGGDPARHKAQVQEAIEVRKVIAFVANSEGTTGRPSLEYITSKRVPVIGSEGAGQWFYESPMYFPQTTHGDAFFKSATYGAALEALPTGKKKMGSTACVEIEACATFDREVAANAQAAGFDQVTRNKASVAQPDYSAECLSARNAGVQTYLVAMDSSSVSRLAMSCARQGYRPLYSVLGSIAADRMKDDPNLDGLIVPSNAFPYFQSGTPATDEFQRVLRHQKGNLALGVGTAVGWVSAKLFEKAARNMPEPPTAEAVLRGLWTIKDDTLGGLTVPLTFAENQKAKTRNCWFTMVVKDRTWTTPDGYKLHCLDPEP